MGKCLFMRKGETHTEPSNIPKNFADATWEQVIEACQKNKVPDTWVVGDSKSMTINGTDYQIDIIGKNHDSYSDGSGTAPLTFQMHDCYAKTYMMSATNSNAVGWGGSDMCAVHLPSVLTLMPSEVQFGIREVNKLTSAGKMSSTINTTVDKLFLLSEIEVFGSVTYSYSGEGSQYAYYAAGNSAVKAVSGSNSEWWLRSPYKSNSNTFATVTSTGGKSCQKAGSAYGVAFAFCF